MSATSVPDDFVLAPNAEPGQNYRLTRRLGGGGFGEVWAADAPGGFTVALKFVRLGKRAAEGEARSLEMLRSLRHPNLLPIFSAWQRGEYLVIGMELADETLLDRLERATGEGLSGIPRVELLDQMREAARGLDYLNEPRHRIGSHAELVGIQHRDIKPQNLMLLGGGVKVADFGLARLMEHSVTGHSGGMTPAYAPPEFFNGEATRQSDQYSLAVTYCHLASNRIPFRGNQANMMFAKLNGEPDLSMLPEAERAVVARAMHRQPAERWPDCRSFVLALTEAAGLSPTAPASSPSASRPAISTEPDPITARPTVTAPPAALPATVPHPAPRRLWRDVLVVLSLFLVVGLAGLGGVLFLGKDARSVFSLVSTRLDTGTVAVTSPVPPDTMTRLQPLAQMQHPSRVVGLAYASNDTILIADATGAVLRWEPNAQAKPAWSARPPFRLGGLTAFPDGKTLVTWGSPFVAGSDLTGVLLTNEAGVKKIGFAKHTGAVTQAAVSPSLNRIASVGADDTLRIWDATSGQEVWWLMPDDGPLLAVAWARQGSLVAAGTANGNVRVWDYLGDSQIVKPLGRHDAPVRQLAFVDEQLLVSAARSGPADPLDDGLCVWRFREPGTPPRRLAGGQTVTALAVLPAGRLVLGTREGALQLWDISAGRQILQQQGLPAPVVALAVSADGRRIVSAKADGLIDQWQVPP